METDPTRMCELLVGLPDVDVIGVGEWPDWTVIGIDPRLARPVCPGCDGRVELCDRRERRLVDLPVFGRKARLVWAKRRWRCRNTDCEVGTWTEVDERIARSGLSITGRAGRWATVQVEFHGRSVAEVAGELGASWTTIMAAVMFYGTPLIDDPDRIKGTTAVGLDEVLFFRDGRYRTRCWSTQIVDVQYGCLIDIVPGRDATEPCRWFAVQPDDWASKIGWATLDLSGPYRKVFDTMLPDAVQVADPFHVRKLANERLDEVRRRVQNDTLGHRGRKEDPLYRIRRLLVMNSDNLTDTNNAKIDNLLSAGDRYGEVRLAWHCKETIAAIYHISDPATAEAFVAKLAVDLQDPDEVPEEFHQFGRTLARWADQVTAWHRCKFTNAPTEAVNNLVKRVKRVAFGLRRFDHYRTRALLYAGRPNWAILNP